MHSFAQRRHTTGNETSPKKTKGLIMDLGWRYDVTFGLMDTLWFRGQVRELRQKTAQLAHLQPGEQV